MVTAASPGTTHSSDVPTTGLFSRDRADHPHAVDQHCQLTRPHEYSHPYGRIHPGGGLAFWCEGSDPTGGR